MRSASARPGSSWASASGSSRHRRREPPRPIRLETGGFPDDNSPVPQQGPCDPQARRLRFFPRGRSMRLILRVSVLNAAVVLCLGASVRADEKLTADIKAGTRLLAEGDRLADEGKPS